MSTLPGPVELLVDRIAVGGDGIARAVDGRVVFVRGALPGERVRAEYTSTGRDFSRAAVLDVLEPSAERRTPTCPQVALGCGGCGWQHVSPGGQMTMKVAMVRDALARQGRLRDAHVVAGVALDPSGYRTTIRLGVDADGRVGFRRAASNDIVVTSTCEAAHPALSSLLPELRAPGCDEVVLRVGVGSGERSALVVADTPGARLVGLPPEVRCGPEALVHEDVAAVRLRVSAGSFFQSSPMGAELLVAAVRSAGGTELATARCWADLYSGIGLFAATITGDAHVVAVELSASSVRDARVNLAGRNATIVESAVEDWRPEPMDAVVADPARAGLGRDGVSVAVATGAPVVVLVSCDAASLGRDTALLGEAGYRHAGSTVLDLFPQTPHVEVVTRFERIGG